MRSKISSIAAIVTVILSVSRCSSDSGEAVRPAQPAMDTQRGSLQGVVRDKAGREAVMASLELRLLADTSVVLGSATGPHGRYIMNELVPGRYAVRVAKYPDLLLRDTVCVSGGATSLMSSRDSGIVTDGSNFLYKADQVHATVFKYRLDGTFVGEIRVGPLSIEIQDGGPRTS